MTILRVFVVRTLICSSCSRSVYARVSSTVTVKCFLQVQAVRIRIRPECTLGVEYVQKRMKRRSFPKRCRLSLIKYLSSLCVEVELVLKVVRRSRYGGVGLSSKGEREAAELSCQNRSTRERKRERRARSQRKMKRWCWRGVLCDESMRGVSCPRPVVD